MWISTILFVVGSLISTLNARSLVVELQTLTTDYNRDLIRHMNLSLITVDNRRVVNGSFATEIDLPFFDLNYVLVLPQFNKRKPVLFNLTLDGCKIMEEAASNNALSLSALVAKNIRTSMKNLPKKCPLKKQNEILVSNLYIDTEAMPSYLPQTPFEFTSFITHKGKMGFSIFASGFVGPKRRRKT